MNYASLTDLLLAVRLEKYAIARLEARDRLHLVFAAVNRSYAHFVMAGDVTLSLPEIGQSVVLRKGDYALMVHGSSHCLLRGEAAAQRGPILKDLTLTDEPSTFDAGEGAAVTARMLSGVFGLAGPAMSPEQSVVPSLVVVRANESRFALSADGGNALWLQCGNGGGGAFAISLLQLLYVMALRTVFHSRRDLGVKDLRLSPIHAAIRLAASRLEEPWTVERLARAVAMSRSVFSAVFMTSVGEPPAHFLNRLRMERAGELLIETELPMSQVALKTGYMSQAAFARAFKRHHRKPPGDYRAEARRLPTGA